MVPEVSGKLVNLAEGYDLMPELIPDYDNLEDRIFSGEFLDKEGDKLAEDFGEDAFTRTFTCAMLENAGRVTKRVKTELYNSGASCHMTTYHDQLENFVLIVPKSIAAPQNHDTLLGCLTCQPVVSQKWMMHRLRCHY